MNIRMIHQVRIMTASFLAAATLLFSILPTVVVGHGYLKSPRSRNYDAHLTQQWEEYCHHCLNRKPATGTCGTSPTFGRNYDQYTSGVKATYTRGQIIDIEVDLTAHHWGHFVIKACPIVTPTPTQTVTQECFNQNPLRFISGENATFDPDYPDRAYLPPPNPPNAPNGAHPQWDCCGGVWNYKYKFQLPPSVTGDLVLLQWHYITANSCLAPGYNTYNWPVGWDPSYLYGGLTPSCVSIPTDGSVESGKRPEQFWNCAEVRITDSGGGGVSPPPPPTPPPSPPIPKLPPTPPPIGTLGYCNWGPAGTAASSTCNKEVQGGEWCNENKNNCEVGCSGKWCTNMMSPTTMKPTTMKPTTKAVVAITKKPTLKPTNKSLVAPTKKPTKKPTNKPLAPMRKPTSLPSIKPTTRTPTLKKPSTPPSQTTCNDSGDYCTKVYCCKWTKNANEESCAYTEPSTGEKGINNNCCPCLPTPTLAPAVVKTCNIFGQVCTQESDCCNGFYCWMSARVCFPDN